MMTYFKLKKSLTKIGINPRFSIDIVSVAERVREFGLIHVEIKSEADIIETLIAFDLKIIKSRHLVFKKDKDSREGMLYDADLNGNPTHCEIWYTSVKNKLDFNFDPFTNPGKYLGYPKCCVNKYENSIGMGSFYKEYLFSGKTRYNEINRLCTLFNKNLLMPDFFPCSLSCKKALEFGQKIQTVTELIYTEDEISETLMYRTAPLVLLSDKLFCFPNYRIEFDRLILKLDDSTKWVDLNNVLNSKYWPSELAEVCILKFQNITGTKDLYIDSNNGLEKLKYAII